MRTFYHLASPFARESILKEGLKPFSKTGRKHTVKYRRKIFLFSDLEQMPWNIVAGPMRDLWEVTLPDRVKVTQDLIALSDGHRTSWMVGWSVPPQNLKFIGLMPHPYEYPYWDVDGGDPETMMWIYRWESG